MGNLTSEPERKGRDLSIEQGQERHSSTEETAKAKAYGLKEMERLRNQQRTDLLPHPPAKQHSEE